MAREDSNDGMKPGGMLLLLVSAFVVWAAVGMFSLWWFSNLPSSGQFGDTFGAANALFSAFAFAGIIYAIILQREDIRLQREDLRLTREEFRRTAEAQEKSERALAKQAWAQLMAAQLNAAASLADAYAKEIDNKQDQKFASSTLNATKQFNKYRQLQEILLCEVQSPPEDAPLARRLGVAYLEKMADRLESRLNVWHGLPPEGRSKSHFWSSFLADLELFCLQDLAKGVSTTSPVHVAIVQLKELGSAVKAATGSEYIDSDYIDKVMTHVPAAIGWIRAAAQA
jgi:hypothetical protein